MVTCRALQITARKQAGSSVLRFPISNRKQFCRSNDSNISVKVCHLAADCIRQSGGASRDSVLHIVLIVF